MKKRIIIILSAVILVVTIAAIIGTNARKDYNGKQVFLRNEQAENSINSFDSKFFTTLCNKTENVNYSAFSIYSLLYSLSKGSDNNTQKEINSVLEYTPSQEVDECIKNKILTTEHKSNSIWYNQDLNLQPAYKDFLADLNFRQNKVDFSEPKQVQYQINSFVSKKTDGLIKKILSTPLPSDTKLVLLNTLFFEQKWLEKFDKAKTSTQDFYVQSNETIYVRMMQDLRYAEYYEDEVLQAAALPYKNTRYSMIVFLPKDKDFDFSKLNLKECVDLFNTENEEQYLQIFLPKFEAHSCYDLIPVLQSMGINDVFQAGASDLSKIFTTSEKLFLNEALHEIVVKVDEEKTKAAAVTMFGAKSAGIEDYITFRADHPFCYVIYDEQNNINLFTGIIRRPM